MVVECYGVLLREPSRPLIDRSLPRHSFVPAFSLPGKLPPSSNIVLPNSAEPSVCLRHRPFIQPASCSPTPRSIIALPNAHAVASPYSRSSVSKEGKVGEWRRQKKTMMGRTVRPLGLCNEFVFLI